MEKEYQNENVKSDNTTRKNSNLLRFGLGLLGCYLVALVGYKLGLLWLMMTMLWVPLCWLGFWAVDIPTAVRDGNYHVNPNMSKMLFAMTFIAVAGVVLAGTVYLWQVSMCGSHLGEAVVFVLSYVLMMLIAFCLLVVLVLLGIFPTIPEYFGI